MREKEPSIDLNKETLSELPFIYEISENKEESQYKISRNSEVNDQLRTNKEIIEIIKGEQEEKEWFTSESWRKKGMPVEQIEFTINNETVTTYNFNTEKQFSDEYIVETKKVLQEITIRFPDILNEIKWILVDNKQPPSLLGDNENYPTNGKAIKKHKAIEIMPQGMETIPHRIQSASVFEGTLVHELGHLIQDKFESVWREKFQWAYCSDNKEDWEIRETSDGKKQWFHNKTGERSLQGQYPLQPEQCITSYARQNIGEDICDSLVSYIYEPEKLKEIAPKKFDIFESYNQNQKQDSPIIEIKRKDSKDIELPEIKPETIKIYVEK